MMTLQAFQDSLAEDAPPPRLVAALQALWWAGKGDWHQAHGFAQRRGGDCDLVHTHLHRQEGDLANAGYWYRRAERSTPDMALQEEWTAIATQLLRQAHTRVGG